MLAATPQNSPVYSVNERSRRIRARTPAVNSIAAKEGTKGKQKTFQNTGENKRGRMSVATLFLGRLFCHGTHGEPGTRRRGLSQTGYLM